MQAVQNIAIFSNRVIECVRGDWCGRKVIPYVQKGLIITGFVGFGFTALGFSSPSSELPVPYWVMGSAASFITILTCYGGRWIGRKIPLASLEEELQKRDRHISHLTIEDEKLNNQTPQLVEVAKKIEQTTTHTSDLQTTATASGNQVNEAMQVAQGAIPRIEISIVQLGELIAKDSERNPLLSTEDEAAHQALLNECTAQLDAC